MRHVLRLWPIMPVALIIGWWNQPYFGWNYCVLGGVTHNSEFIQELYPHHSGLQADVLNQNRPRVFMSSKYEPFEMVTQERVDFVETQAYAQMAACLSERDVRYCRYAGADPAAMIRDDQERFSIPQAREPDYRFIIPDTDVSMTFIPLEGGLGAWMTIADHQNNWAVTRTTCNLGCGCNPRYDG